MTVSQTPYVLDRQLETNNSTAYYFDFSNFQGLWRTAIKTLLCAFSLVEIIEQKCLVFKFFVGSIEVCTLLIVILSCFGKELTDISTVRIPRNSQRKAARDNAKISMKWRKQSKEGIFALSLFLSMTVSSFLCILS